MILRTDLALENREAEGSRGLHQRDQDGCRVTTLVVEKQEESRYQKPQGTYITVEMEPFSDHLDRENRYRKIVAEELKKLLPMRGTVLVAGLGNREITPDALGPKTADRVLATRHIAGELQRLTGNDYFRPVVTVTPNVLGNTGMEAAELLSSLTKHLKPSAVIVVDALASRSLHRLGCTVQLSDGGHCARFRCGEYSPCHQSRNSWRSGHCHRCSYGCRRCHVGIGIIRGKRDPVFSADCSSGIPQRGADGGDATRD